jgi:hypothetical protein
MAELNHWNNILRQPGCLTVEIHGFARLHCYRFALIGVAYINILTYYRHMIELLKNLLTGIPYKQFKSRKIIPGN